MSENKQKEDYGVLQIYEDGSVDNNIEISAYRGKIHFEIDNPWAGCTETGFGATTNFDCGKEAAIKIRDFINKYLEE